MQFRQRLFGGFRRRDVDRTCTDEPCSYASFWTSGRSPRRAARSATGPDDPAPLDRPFCFHAIERVHHPHETVVDPHLDGVGGPGNRALHPGHFRRARTWPARGRPDPAEDRRGPRRSGAARSRSCRVRAATDRKPLWPPSDPVPRARRPPERQVHVVGDDEQIGNGDLIVTSQRRRPPARSGS